VPTSGAGSTAPAAVRLQLTEEVGRGSDGWKESSGHAETGQQAGHLAEDQRHVAVAVAEEVPAEMLGWEADLEQVEYVLVGFHWVVSDVGADTACADQG
jgi:hypothetical protein